MKRELVAAGLALWTIARPAGAVGDIVDVTIYDRTDKQVLPIHRHEGRYYVVGKPGNEYQIRVRNRTSGDILSVVSVDGVNAVSGETADWHQTGYILGPQQGFNIKGWRKSLERVATFFFTEHQNSYAARTGRSDNVGVIGVAVFRKKPDPDARIDQSPPRAESPAPNAREGDSASADAARAAGGPVHTPEAAARLIAPDAQLIGKSSSLGTGHGRSQPSRVKYASFERATARPEAVIAIHYDTYSNLVALGVIRAPRIATPFPGQFVPDPM